MQGDFAGYASPGPIARALVLALSVCYHARLQNRAEYEEGVATHFRDPIQLVGGAQQFRDEIRWCVALTNVETGLESAFKALCYLHSMEYGFPSLFQQITVYDRRFKVLLI